MQNYYVYIKAKKGGEWQHWMSTTVLDSSASSATY